MSIPTSKWLERIKSILIYKYKIKLNKLYKYWYYRSNLTNNYAKVIRTTYVALLHWTELKTTLARKPLINLFVFFVSMLSVAKRFQLRPLTTPFLGQLRYARTRPKSPPVALRKTEERSEWWAVDGEMHEIGDHVPLRERFVIPRENIPNKRRKQLREQFMRRTRLVLKESVSPLLFLSIFCYLFSNYILFRIK